MTRFAIATLLPFALLLAAAFAGAPWGWLALGYITLLVFLIDRFSAPAMANAPAEAEFPASKLLLVTLGLLHFIALTAIIWAAAGSSGLGLTERMLVAFSGALVMGQISHPVAHELIHQPGRVPRLLGKLIYSSLLFGHHASAHLRVHHVYVGSKDDPNSARWGEGFWRFLIRAWPGGFLAGLRAETRLRRGKASGLGHPYLLYLGGAVATVLLAAALAGAGGVVVLIFVSLYAQIQIFLSDYVQHYGLRRATLPGGGLEPVGPQHSWNAPHAWSAAMTLNAPRHSDHHVTPARAYPALQLRPDDMPTLPHSLPVMAVLALHPPLWRRIMNPRCSAWQANAAGQTGKGAPTGRATPKTSGTRGADLTK